MRPSRSSFLHSFWLLLSMACTGARPATAIAPVSEENFVSIARADSLPEVRWSNVRAFTDSRGFRTDLLAKAAPDGGGGELEEVHFTLIRLHGPGEYSLGFAWDRGQSRFTLQTRAGPRCMTPGSNAGTVEVTLAPEGRPLAPGDRLEGRYRVRCSPDGGNVASEQLQVFTGSFAVTLGQEE